MLSSVSQFVSLQKQCFWLIHARILILCLYLRRDVFKFLLIYSFFCLCSRAFTCFSFFLFSNILPPKLKSMNPTNKIMNLEDESYNKILDSCVFISTAPSSKYFHFPSGKQSYLHLRCCCLPESSYI